MFVVLIASISRSAHPQGFAAWRWQRTVRSAPDSPVSEQCVVLDADFYAKAAPGLRDVRLIQDGRLLAYALQESYDSVALENHAPARMLADRSLYTTVLRVPLSTGARMQTGAALLRQHVPVERMELVPAGSAAHIQFRLSATPRQKDPVAPGRASAEPELVDAPLSADSPVVITALGANLQSDADVAVAVSGDGRFSEALLEMHQRSICYQPLSRSPLVLLAGNAGARPVHYDYATHFHPVAKPLLASMGPAEPNPAYRPATETHFFTRRTRLLTAIAAAGAAFLLTALPLLRRFR